MDEPERPPILPNEPIDLYDYYPQFAQINPQIRKKLYRRLLWCRALAIFLYFGGIRFLMPLMPPNGFLGSTEP